MYILCVPASASLESALQNATFADAIVKQRMAVYTDAMKKAKPSVVEFGDKALFCNKTIKTSFRLGMILIRTQLSKDEVQVLFYNEMRKHQ